jgi:hypothetical protein
MRVNRLVELQDRHQAIDLSHSTRSKDSTYLGMTRNPLADGSETGQNCPFRG